MGEQKKKEKGAFFTNYERKGYFGDFGGRYSPEVLISALSKLELTFSKLRKDHGFQKEVSFHLKNYAARPSLLYYSKELTDAWGGAEIFLKREDLNHTGSHKINNALGQALLAKRMGQKRVIAETGAGQHGVATATVAAYMGLDAHIYMGAKDLERQKLNSFRMQMLGATVTPVHSGTATLKDATNEAMRDWAKNVKDTYYIIGSVIGPHPYPSIVREFQSCIGKETRVQALESFDALPDAIVACVGGGSNAIGIFSSFLEDEKVELWGIEAGGLGDKLGENAASLDFGSVGYFHGNRSFYIQSEDGNISDVHSISAGLDYPGVGPEHAYLAQSGRVSYTHVSDKEAVDSFLEVAEKTGIIVALETAHALAYTKKLAKKLGKKKRIIVCLSGRGDKDVASIQQLLAGDSFSENG